MKNLYCFSGLGADERVFQNLILPGYKMNFIIWEKPYVRESLGDYSKRLLSQIDDPNPILMGVSFGGMVAIEVAKIIPAAKVILISSAKAQYEIPLLYKLTGKFRLHRVVPAIVLKWANPFSYWLFGVWSREDKELLKGILQDTDTVFLKWAIDAIVNWNNKVIPKHLTHIHGAQDRILPIQNINDSVIVQGGHLAIWNNPEEVSIAIISALKD